MRLTLSRQFVLVAALLGLIGLVGGGVIESAVARLDGTAAQVNLAGSLRWLTRDIHLETQRYLSGHTRDAELVEERLQRLESNLAALEKGGTTEGRAVPPLPAGLRPQLDAVRGSWTHFRRHAREVVARPAAGGDSRGLLDDLHRDAGVLFATADRLTGALSSEVESLHDAIRGTLRFAALTLGAILVITLLALRKRVVAPLQDMAQTARRFAAGEQAARTRYRADDEIGDLAAAFDDMAGEIGSRIDELTKAQAELRKLSLAVEYSPASVMITDAEGVIEHVNPRFTTVTGYAAQEAVGRKPSFLKAGVMNNAVYAELWRTVSDGRRWRGRLLNRKKSGTVFWEDTWIAPIRDDSGRISHYVAVKEDITEQVRVEEEKAHMQEDLERRVASRTQQLSATVKELETFSYSVSHDLRAPLRAIHGFAHLMEEQCADCEGTEARGHLQRIRSASLRMGEIIDDLLDLARISRNELRIVDVDFTAMARLVLATLAAAEPERSVVVHVQKGILLWADAGMLRLALENLLGNAWKFTAGREPAEIRVTARRKDTETEILIADNGAGFDMAFADKLFQPFQRLHGREEFEGNGIGLATVARIVHLHGGRVWAEAWPGRGAAFHVALPAGNGALLSSKSPSRAD
ncbi:MAG: PAS domain S-box protein [Rhodocyclales bacterium]|nr:PAS domain S-box protein [Rhodocyclales bacterium]